VRDRTACIDPPALRTVPWDCEIVLDEMSVCRDVDDLGCDCANDDRLISFGGPASEISIVVAAELGIESANAYASTA